MLPPAIRSKETEARKVYIRAEVEIEKAEEDEASGDTFDTVEDEEDAREG